MPRTCSICAHPERLAIDKAVVAQDSIRGIAAIFRVSSDALQRHKGHIPQALAQARQAHEVANADDLLNEVNKLRMKAYALLQKAEQSGDYRTAIAGLKAALSCLELQGKLMGELNDSPTVNILINPQWLMVRTTLLEALLPHPQARQDVATALLALEGRGNGH